ncbi:hypothetical protein Hanom_Chr00s000004g01606141 [Helianthus anomalus]
MQAIIVVQKLPDKHKNGTNLHFFQNNYIPRNAKVLSLLNLLWTDPLGKTI